MRSYLSLKKRFPDKLNRDCLEVQSLGRGAATRRFCALLPCSPVYMRCAGSNLVFYPLPPEGVGIHILSGYSEVNAGPLINSFTTTKAAYSGQQVEIGGDIIASGLL